MRASPAVAVNAALAMPLTVAKSQTSYAVVFRPQACPGEPGETDAAQALEIAQRVPLSLGFPLDSAE